VREKKPVRKERSMDPDDYYPRYELEVSEYERAGGTHPYTFLEWLALEVSSEDLTE
jgi:hypothetical protein